MGNVLIEIKCLESMALFYTNDLNKENYLDKTSEHLAKLESIKGIIQKEDSLFEKLNPNKVE